VTTAQRALAGIGATAATFAGLQATGTSIPLVLWLILAALAAIDAALVVAERRHA
jgi:hypothetical protein